jgi:hypothetical protein
MKRQLATGIASLVAAGSIFAASALPAEAASNARPHRTHATQVHKTPNPHAGQRCAAYSFAPRGQHRSCTRYVPR